ncbi:MAG: hypothetical protein OK457_06555 [Thaumarchaeota archaeon]|nr:hypothetical protein [Nitrososphaerota archaeon]
MKLHLTAKLLGGVAPPIFALVAVVLLFTNRSSAVFGTPLLATILYVAFVGAIYLLVSFISALSYVRSGNVSFLLLGSSLVIGGCSAILTFSLSSAPNYSVTVANLGFLISAFLNFVSALNVYARVRNSTDGRTLNQNKKWIGIPIIVYSTFAALSVLIAVLALSGATPPFFVQGVGGTVLRQEVVAACVALFGISALIFLKMSRESHSDILFWYSGGLAMLSLCFFVAFSLSVVGGELSWTGRIAQYLSGIYFLMLVLSSIRGSRKIPKENSLQEKVTEIAPERR